jgi:hypothetical protein
MYFKFPYEIESILFFYLKDKTTESSIGSPTSLPQFVLDLKHECPLLISE